MSSPIKGGSLGIADGIGQRGDRMGAAVDPLGPGARWQDADHARAGFRSAAIRRRGLSNAGEIPARPPSRLGLLHRAPRLPAIERDRGDSHRHLVAIGIAQFNRFNRKLSLCDRVDYDGTD
jgi:hypothetical protein